MEMMLPLLVNLQESHKQTISIQDYLTVFDDPRTPYNTN